MTANSKPVSLNTVHAACLLVLSILIMLSVCGCSHKKATEPAEPSAEAKVTSAERQFAFEFLKAANQMTVDSNLICNPFNIMYNYAQLWLGMGTDAATEVAQAMHAGTMSRDLFSQTSFELLQKLKNNGGSLDFHCTIVDCLDFQPYYEQYLAKCSTLLGIDVIKVDCASDYADTVIHDLLANNSNGYFTVTEWELADTNGDIFMYNFFPFDAAWSIPFDPMTLTAATFPTSSGEMLPCSLMTAIGQYRMWQNTEFTAIHLTHTDSTFVTTFILPADSVDINDMIANFSVEDWDNALSQFTLQSVTLTIPKWTHLFEMQDIVPAMRQLGVNRIYNSVTGNFTDMLADNIYFAETKIYGWQRLLPDSLGNMAHKPAVVSDAQDVVLTFNRPFIDIVWHKPTGLILQINKIERPEIN